MKTNRRQHPRVLAAVDAIVEASGHEWQGKTIELSASSAKVALSAQSVELPCGTSVQVRFRIPDADLAPPVRGDVFRWSDDGVVLCFTDLGGRQLQDLRHFVNSLLLRECQVLLDQPGRAEARETQAYFSPRPAKREAKPDQPDALPAPARGVETDLEPSRWQALLGQLGLDLRPPAGGILCREWRAFLIQLEAELRGKDVAERTSRTKTTPAVDCGEKPGRASARERHEQVFEGT